MTITSLMWIRIFAIIGSIVAAYGVHVRMSKKASKKYTALCDFNKKASCSAVLTGEHSNILGVPNTILGVFYYPAVYFAAYFGQSHIIKALALAALLGSVYLAYRQYFSVKKFCLVCNVIYVLSILIFWFSLCAVV